MIKANTHKTSKRLTVGVTGHRLNRLPQDKAKIASDVADVLRTLQDARTARSCRLVSGLAEGADRIAAYAALGLGWRLDAILAFHRSRFEEDFASCVSVGEFRALIAAASDISEPHKGWHRNRPVEDGYEAVGNKIVRSSDILLAIWDGQPSQGLGGTVEVMEAAAAQGIPVIWIHTRNRSPQHFDLNTTVKRSRRSRV